tara:strand:+ start:16 stop:846 length:831 start_codon:yes stop_codon:yes gene_type:complete
MKYNEQNLFHMIYESGEIACKHFNTLESKKYKKKADKSPVSIADIEIDNFIKLYLKKSFPNIEVLSEEDTVKNQKKALKKNIFFIIDPIDGTSAFVKADKEFTINVSLIKNNCLVFSLIYSPILDVMIYADLNYTYKITKIENEFKKNKLSFIGNKSIKKQLNIITTKRNDEIAKISLYLKKNNIKYELKHYSSSIKFCYIALGMADMYIRKEKIKIWDVIAGFHIVKNAGYNIYDNSGNNLYNYFLKSDYLDIISDKGFRVEEFIITNNDKFLLS